MDFCDGSFSQELTVLNLLASRGYVYRFLHRLWWLIIYAYFGHDGKGSLASCTLAFSFLLFGSVIVEAVANYDAHLLYKNSVKFDRDLSKWLAVSLVHVAVTSLTMIIFITLIGYLFHSVIDLKIKVLYRSQRLLLLLSPLLLLHGISCLLIALCEFSKRPRALMTSVIVQALIMLIGCLLLLYVIKIGHIGSVIFILGSNLASIAILAAATANSIDYFTAVRKALQKIQRIPRQCLRLASPITKPAPPLQSDQTIKTVQDDVVEIEMVLQESKDEDSTLDEVDNAPLLADNNATTSIEEADGRDNVLVQHDSNRSSSEVGKVMIKTVLDRLPGIIVAVVHMTPQYMSPLFLTSLGTYAIDALQLQLALLLFINFALVYPLSAAVTLRLRAHLKADSYSTCRTTIFIGAMQTFIVISLISLLIFFTKEMFWPLFTTNHDLLQRTIDQTPLALCYLLPFAMNTYFCGVYRGLGRVGEANMLMFLGLWLVGMPAGVGLAITFRPVYNLMGYWIGLIVGSALTTVVMFCQLMCLNYKAEKKKVEFRLRRHNQAVKGNHTAMLVDDSILFGDYSVVSVYSSHSFGSFEMKSKTLEEEILELEAIELNEDS